MRNVEMVSVGELQIRALHLWSNLQTKFVGGLYFMHQAQASPMIKLERPMIIVQSYELDLQHTKNKKRKKKTEEEYKKELKI